MKCITKLLYSIAEQARADRQQNANAIECLTKAFQKQATIQAANSKADRMAKYVPQMPSMTNEEDIAEYLETFEQTQMARQVPPEAWAQTLTPLLNQTCRDNMLYLPPEIKLSYPDLKQVLLASISRDDRSAAKKYFTAYKKQNQSWRQLSGYISKQSRKFAIGETAQQIREQYDKEMLIQLMPVETATYVREREPDTLEEAVQLAENHFLANNVNQFNWEGHKQNVEKYKYSIKPKPNRFSPNQPAYYSNKLKPDHYKYSQHKHYNSFQQPRDQYKQSFDRYKQPNDQPTTKYPNNKESTATETNIQKFKPKTDLSKIQCFKCHQYGHFSTDCTVVALVSVPSLQKLTSKPLYKPGKVGDRPVEFLMDSGADLSVITPDLLPTEYKQCHPVMVKAVGNKPALYQTVVIPAEIDGHTLPLYCAVTPDDKSTRAIIGRNVPGLDIDWHVSIRKRDKDTTEQPTSTTQKTHGKEIGGAGECISQVVQERATFPVSSPQPVSVPTKQPTDKQIPSTATKQDSVDLSIFDLDELQPADILAIQTRAMKKRQEQQEQKNDKATADSGVIITPLSSNNEASREEIMHDAVKTTDEESEVSVNIQLSDEDEEVLPAAPVEITPPFNRNQLIQAQQQDEEFKLLWKDLETNPRTYFTKHNDILYARDIDPASACPLKIVVPKTLRKHVLEAGHDCTGHFGKNKNIQLCFYWPGISKDTADFCRQCPTCSRFNHHRRQKPPMQIIPTVATPWQKLALDIVGPLHRSKKGNKYVLTIVDFATRYAEAIPMKKITAEETAQVLLDTFARFDVPQEIVTDNGSNFTANIMEHLLKSLTIHHIKTSPYNPQANGMVERVNGVIKKALVKAGAGNTNWDTLLPKIMMAIRTTPHASTNLSPFQLMFGRQPNTPIQSMKNYLEEKEEQLPQPVHDYLRNLCYQLSLANNIAEQSDHQAKLKSKTYQDKNCEDSPLNIGDLALCFEPRQTGALSAKWDGPYPILAKPTNVTYILDMGKNKTIQ